MASSTSHESKSKHRVIGYRDQLETKRPGRPGRPNKAYRCSGPFVAGARRAVGGCATARDCAGAAEHSTSARWVERAARRVRLKT